MVVMELDEVDVLMSERDVVGSTASHDKRLAQDCWASEMQDAGWKAMRASTGFGLAFARLLFFILASLRPLCLPMLYAVALPTSGLLFLSTPMAATAAVANEAVGKGLIVLSKEGVAVTTDAAKSLFAKMSAKMSDTVRVGCRR